MRDSFLGKICTKVLDPFCSTTVLTLCERTLNKSAPSTKWRPATNRRLIWQSKSRSVRIERVHHITAKERRREQSEARVGSHKTRCSSFARPVCVTAAGRAYTNAPYLPTSLNIASASALRMRLLCSILPKAFAAIIMRTDYWPMAHLQVY